MLKENFSAFLTSYLSFHIPNANHAILPLISTLTHSSTTPSHSSKMHLSGSTTTNLIMEIKQGKLRHSTFSATNCFAVEITSSHLYSYAVVVFLHSLMYGPLKPPTLQPPKHYCKMVYPCGIPSKLVHSL